MEDHEGARGYQDYFGFLAIVSFVGLAATIAIHLRTRASDLPESVSEQRST